MQKTRTTISLIILAITALFLTACDGQRQAPKLPPELAQGDPIATPFDRRPSALNRDEFQAAETVARVLRFSPGQLDGEPVPVWLELPIIFGLEDD